MNAEAFLRLVAGEDCPCGHDKDRHHAPKPNKGETMGACMDCECKGVIEVDW